MDIEDLGDGRYRAHARRDAATRGRAGAGARSGVPPRGRRARTTSSWTSRATRSQVLVDSEVLTRGRGGRAGGCSLRAGAAGFSVERKKVGHRAHAGQGGAGAGGARRRR